MTPSAATPNTPTRRAVLLIVIDGLGFDRARSKHILDLAWPRLETPDQQLLLAQAESALSRHPGCTLTPEELALLSLAPIHAEMIKHEAKTSTALEIISALKAMRAANDGTLLRSRIDERLISTALKQRYVPWVADAPRLTRFRNSHLSIPTSAAGEYAGFENVIPVVQGNSETGHQQIGSLSLAAQTPLEITTAIDNGEFFDNPALVKILEPVANGEANLDFCFMLSGTDGSDGRVHSAWNHLEAFLELVFVRKGIPPERVRMQAILDGRDGFQRGSIEVSPGGTGDYLRLLEQLLSKYDATASLAWVVGRATAMDRDYREPSGRADYELLTRGNGQAVNGFAGARATIAESHANGMSDQDIPPLVVNHESNKQRVLESGDSFVNLNFRSDRQRVKTATLTGAKEFLQKESRARGHEWRMDWMDADLRLNYCCLAQYDPALDRIPGVSVAFPVSPLPATLFELWPQVMNHSKYVLAGESVKASHMGYFLRGRREEPSSTESERRWITPSAGESEGVRSDSDFHVHPEMKMGDVAEFVVGCLRDSSDRLIVCNLAAPDMVGHLLPDRFEAAVAAYEATDKAVDRMARAALSNGYTIILTSDHGNIEEDGPSHTSNDVLTTIASPGAPYEFARRSTFQVRLFDISMTIAHILGFEREAEEFQKRSPYHGEDRFAGRSIAS